MLPSLNMQKLVQTNEAIERAIYTEISDVLPSHILYHGQKVRMQLNYVPADKYTGEFEMLTVTVKDKLNDGFAMICVSSRHLEEMDEIMRNFGFEFFDVQSSVHTWEGKATLSQEIKFIRRETS